MAKIEEDSKALGNYNKDGSQSDNESSDDLSPIATKKEKKKHRKRSSSLPFIETNHAGLWKGLVAAEERQFVKSKGASPKSRTVRKPGKEWKDLSGDETTGKYPKTVGADVHQHRPTRRSSSMPEFYCPEKDEFSRHRKITRSGSKLRNKAAGTASTDLEMKELDEERFKLPVISSGECINSSKCLQDQNGNEMEALNQAAESLKIQRKTYLPRISSNNGGVFMKLR